MARARTRTRDEIFPADRGLMARMVLVSVLTPLVVLGLLGACFAVLSTEPALALAGVALLGAVRVVRDIRRRSGEALLGDGEEPELVAIIHRLCALADLPVPEVAVHDERQANSWIVDPIGRPPRLHVTRGLLDLLEPVELEAVIAHELAHVANHDATVMTVVATPVAALMESSTSNVGYWVPMLLGRLTSGAIAFVAGFGSMALARYRELTADAGAVALTGRPAALASALRKVTGELAITPVEDLRLAAARDALHLVAVERDRHWLWGWHGPTHPSLERRIAVLERMEHQLAHGRRA